ncbi:MAG: hypothetical protein UY21_C0026G0016 [Microgenomates group bacterium GW2011_GWA1_48_10]|uniref:Large ribosomal subunit protein uL29 n=1 Tax=Candidatus Gottesmanbacteria bacterium RIFCSPHIGHO2_01_FULL_47_48 TaxID=1798381 RepID=A0A1F6A2H8_9BACT|nr:MAG: hypothetical protein UY21_C0026G0016 [Microgenomates group bacterium GW2011_GWA1_48_10]OGG18873.1 MAG: 50S ribosomal protein L29 [Candidatus Gottesmanbacteria bacterium RIFCSPHIGHO2_01_FULL_47_48]
MKKKDLTSLTSKSPAELAALRQDLTGQITRARMEIAMHKAKNTNIAKNLKKTLAQLLTIKREKELFEREKGEGRREK